MLVDGGGEGGQLRQDGPVQMLTQGKPHGAQATLIDVMSFYFGIRVMRRITYDLHHQSASKPFNPDRIMES